MLGVFAAPTAVLFEFDFALDFLPIFAAPIVNALAAAAGEFDELILRHKLVNFELEYYIAPTPKKQIERATS